MKMNAAHSIAEISPSVGESVPAWHKALALLSTMAALTFGLLLGVRPLVTPNLGYHLAYGERVLDTGRIVDCNNDFIYTLASKDTPPDKRPAPGPGCWYDEQGNYRFPNANWLSQVIQAAVYRVGGVTGLCLLEIALVGGIFGVSLLTLRRWGVGWSLAGAALLLMAMVAYGRLFLRPEIFGYLLLSGQL